MYGHPGASSCDRVRQGAREALDALLRPILCIQARQDVDHLG